MAHCFNVYVELSFYLHDDLLSIRVELKVHFQGKLIIENDK